MPIIQIATDGSCIQPGGWRDGDPRPRPGAAAFILERHDGALVRFAQPKADTTIGRMEMTALAAALDHVLTLPAQPGLSYQVLCDRSTTSASSAIAIAIAPTKSAPAAKTAKASSKDTSPVAEPITIPEYPFFNVDGPERVFGSPIERYLADSKEEARRICKELPAEARAAEYLFSNGHLGGCDAIEGRDCVLEVSAEAIRDTTMALLCSFAPPHEVKIATVAVALHRWFPPR